MLSAEPNSLSLPTKERSRNIGVTLTALGLATILAIQVLSINTGVHQAMSTDDAMRLVQVRDLVLGQSWFDLWQYRLNPPGVLMHWSRVIDLPLAGLYLAMAPMVGSSQAEAITLFLWPLALFGVALALIVAIARRMSNGAIAAQISAAVLALMAKPALTHFRPGAIDHHNAQICLLLALVLFSLQVEQRASKAALAGVAASLSLAIGVETLPFIAAVSVAIGGLFVWRGTPVGGPVATYAMALAGSSLVFAFALLPLPALLSPVCDSLGGPILMLTVGGGISLALMVAIDRYFPGVVIRLAAVAVAAVVVIGAFAFHFRGCLASPYAMLDPLVVSLWLDKVQETVSLGTMFRLGPEEVPSFYAFPLITLGLAAAALIRSHPGGRFKWALAVLVLGTQFGLGLWQMRGTGIASMMAAPIFAAAVISVCPRLGGGRNLLVLAFAVSPTTFAIFGLLVKPLTDSIFKPEMTSRGLDAAKCIGVSDVASLKQLPKGRVMAPIDLGPAILAETEHQVFAAPYHRNEDGNLAMLKLMLAPIQIAHEMLSDRRVDYVVVCRTSPNQDLIDLAPNGLEAKLARGEAPAFLAPIDLGNTAKIAAWRLLK